MKDEDREAIKALADDFIAASQDAMKKARKLRRYVANMSDVDEKVRRWSKQPLKHLGKKTTMNARERALVAGIEQLRDRLIDELPKYGVKQKEIAALVGVNRTRIWERKQRREQERTPNSSPDRVSHVQGHFTCKVCGENFSDEVWHCECGRHWTMYCHICREKGCRQRRRLVEKRRARKEKTDGDNQEHDGPTSEEPAAT